MTTAVFAPPCATDPDLFFSDAPADVEQAKEICFGCPRRTGCLERAIADQPACGVWGGVLFARGEPVKVREAPVVSRPVNLMNPEGNARGREAANANRAAKRDERLKRYAAFLEQGIAPIEAGDLAGLTMRTRERYDRKLAELEAEMEEVAA